MISSLPSLTKLLRRAPIAPTSVAALLERQEVVQEFHQIVQAVFPDAAAEIWEARTDGANRENARVWAFLHRVEAECFPIYECDEYEQVFGGIPFVRNAWGYERFHDLNLRPGELLLFILCASPYDDAGIRLPALDAVEAHVPKEVLRDIPEEGLTPIELQERLEGRPYAATADFAAWLWGETGSVFLDLDDEVEVVDAEWTQENVQTLVAQWGQAQGVLKRVSALAAWLEGDPADHVARLLDASLARDPHVAYLQERRFYDQEITEHGLVPIVRDDVPDLTLPVGVPA